MTEDDNARAGRKQKDLCQRYGITDSQLDFGYVQECKNVTELEKILKILRSNEVGHFEKLEETTEKRLSELAPNSRALLTPQPAPLWDQLDTEQQKEISRDFFQNWTSFERNISSQSLGREMEEIPADFDQRMCKNYPAIRNSGKTVISNKKTEQVNKEKSTKSCVPRSYDSWNDFNVEKELHLMDREDELKSNAAIRAKNEGKSLQEESNATVGIEECGAGDVYRQKAAQDERLKGNEFFKAKDFAKALEHYTRSITFNPTAECFNNRAQTYIKQQRYEEALADCKKVMTLSTDSKTVSKALYRRSTAFKALNRYEEAYEEIRHALKKDPNDKAIQDRANELQDLCVFVCGIKPVRMVIEDQDTQRSNPLIEEIAPRDQYYPFTNASDNVHLNDIGTALFMCGCSGVPPFIAKLRSGENLPKSNRLYLRKTRPKKSLNDKNLSNRRKIVSSVKNGEIIEKDTIEDVEKKVFNEEAKKIDSMKFNLVSSLKRGDLEAIVNGMAALQPSQVCEVLYNRLDASILNLCVKALCVHLKEPSMWKTIQEHLLALAQLPQFRSSVKSLERSTKDTLSERIASIEEQGQRVSNVVTNYELNGALPPP